MKKWMIGLALFLFPLLAYGQPSSYATLYCVNPSGQVIPVLQAGTAASTNYPGVQAFGMNSLHQSVSLKCDASGNLLADASSFAGIPFVNTPFPSLGDVICYDGVAYTPCPPSAGAAQILYDTGTASDITGYDLWDTTPFGAQFTVPVTIPATTTKTLLKAFATASGYPNITVIPAGDWHQDTYVQVSSAANTTTLQADVYDRTSLGVETLLFSFADITVSGKGTAVQVVGNDAIEPAFTIAATDRLVIKYSMTKTGGASITGTLYGGGSANYSHVHTPVGTSAGGVTQIIAGTNVTISPSGGTGAVTVNATGGGGAGLPVGYVDPVATYNAAGVTTATTGTVSSGSTSLTVASATGWSALEGISIDGAGTGVASITSASGGSVTGPIGSTCYLKGFNNGSTALAVATLVSANTIVGATFQIWPGTGVGLSSAPTSATLYNGMPAGTGVPVSAITARPAFCSGTATLTTTTGPSMLVTSVSTIAGSTFTLADSATVSVVAAAVKHDDTAAFAAAIASGLNVYVRPGNYNITTALAVTTAVTISCASGATFVNPRTTGDVFRVTYNVSGVGAIPPGPQINNCAFSQDAAVTPFGGSGIHYGQGTQGAGLYTSGLQVRGNTFNSMWTGIYVDAGSWMNWIDENRVVNPVSGFGIYYNAWNPNGDNYFGTNAIQNGSLYDNRSDTTTFLNLKINTGEVIFGIGPSGRVSFVNPSIEQSYSCAFDMSYAVTTSVFVSPGETEPATFDVCPATGSPSNSFSEIGVNGHSSTANLGKTICASGTYVVLGIENYIEANGSSCTLDFSTYAGSFSVGWLLGVRNYGTGAVAVTGTYPMIPVGSINSVAYSLYNGSAWEALKTPDNSTTALGVAACSSGTYTVTGAENFISANGSSCTLDFSTAVFSTGWLLGIRNYGTGAIATSGTAPVIPGVGSLTFVYNFWNGAGWAGLAIPATYNPYTSSHALAPADGVTGALGFYVSGGTLTLPTYATMGSHGPWFVGNYYTGPLTIAAGSGASLLAVPTTLGGLSGMALCVNSSSQWFVCGSQGANAYYTKVSIGTITATNDLNFDGQAARKQWMERNTTANTAGNSFTAQAGGATVGATDKAGGDYIIAPGLSTGTGVGAVRIQGMTRASSTGTADNALVDRFIVPSSVNLTNTTPAALFTIALPTLAMAGGQIDYTIVASDGTDMQSLTGVAYYSEVNKGGVYTGSITASELNAAAVSSGTLTDAWTITTGTNTFTINVAATSSLTPTTLKIRYTITNNSGQAVTVN